MNDNGIITVSSPFDVKKTMDKLCDFITSKGATVYNRIDQQAELKKAGLSIPPLEFILFGNPASGGKLMMEIPLVALDLPLKIIAWEDENGKVWLAYNQEEYLQRRHGLKVGNTAILNLEKIIAGALNLAG